MTEPKGRDVLSGKVNRWRDQLRRLPTASGLLSSDKITRWGAPAALGAIGVLDRVAASRDWHLSVIGMLDEPAHLLTAGLVLALLPRSFATRVLTVVDPAEDAVAVGADVLVVKWPRPVVSGGAVVVAVPGLSAQ